MAQALRRLDADRQMDLDSGWSRQADQARPHSVGHGQSQGPLCAGCRAREARYGFRNEEHPESERPRTLCFDCFRMEITRRQAVAARLARSWNAEQTALPLEETLERLSRQRRRAQIAARHALGA